MTVNISKFQTNSELIPVCRECFKQMTFVVGEERFFFECKPCISKVIVSTYVPPIPDAPKKPKREDDFGFDDIPMAPV